MSLLPAIGGGASIAFEQPPNVIGSGISSCLQGETLTEVSMHGLTEVMNMNRANIPLSSAEHHRHSNYEWRYMRYMGRPGKVLLRHSPGRGIVAGYKWARDHADYEALKCLVGRNPDGVVFRGFEGLDMARYFISTYRELPFENVSDGDIYDFWGDLGLDEDVSDLTSPSFWWGFSQGAIEWFNR